MNICSAPIHVNEFFFGQKNLGMALFPGIFSRFFPRQDSVPISNLKGKNCSEIECKKDLEVVFQQLLQEGKIQEVLQSLQALAGEISIEGLDDVIQRGDVLIKEAELHQRITKDHQCSAISEAFQSFVNAIAFFVETLISFIGVRDLFLPGEGEVHSVMIRSQKIVPLMFLFQSALATGGAAILGEIFLGLTCVSAIWPWIKPMPSYLPLGAECWTSKNQEVAYGRKESLDEIAGILKMNRHALLVGPSRVGKSLTAKALAQAIERGEYPELKGKVVFRFNMADLIDQQASFVGGSNKTLSQISDAMGRYRKDIILVFDEIHMACKNNQKMADQLKLFLDEGGEFPHVIGITTEEEYEKHVKENQAFSLRFDQVKIASTNQEETLMILKEAVVKSRSSPLLSEEGALQTIYQKSQQKESPQPAEALKLLKKCIQRTEQTQRSPLEKKRAKLVQKLDGFYLQPGLYAEKKALEVQLVELEKQLLLEEQENKRVFQAKSTLDRAKMQMYQALLKARSVIEGKASSLQEYKQLQYFFLLNRILCPFLESYVKTKSKEFGIKAIIDQELVEELSADVGG